MSVSERGEESGWQNLIGTTPSLAFYKVLKARGVALNTIGKIHHETVEKYLYSLPRWRFGLQKALFQTGIGQKLVKWLLKKMAERSHSRRYLDDFVFQYVEGDGKNFDFGIDYTECAIVKLYRSQGAEEFTRFVCLFDYPHSQLSGSGLMRTITLAEGGDRCDFRFRIGKEPENRQATQIATLRDSL